MSCPSAGRLWIELAGWTLTAATGLAAIAHWSIARRGMAGAIEGLWLGAGIAWSASLAGAIPIARALARDGGPGTSGVAAVGWATALRMGVALGLALAGIAAGIAPAAPILLAVAVGYLALLAVETTWAVRRMRGGRRIET